MPEVAAAAFSSAETQSAEVSLSVAVTEATTALQPITSSESAAAIDDASTPSLNSASDVPLATNLASDSQVSSNEVTASQSAATQSSVAESAALQSVGSESVALQTAASQPAASQSAPAETTAIQSVASDPAVSNPVVSNSAVSNSAVSNPVASQSAAPQSAASDIVVSNAVASNPAMSEPAVSNVATGSGSQPSASNNPIPVATPAVSNSNPNSNPNSDQNSDPNGNLNSDPNGDSNSNSNDDTNDDSNSNNSGNASTNGESSGDTNHSDSSDTENASPSAIALSDFPKADSSSDAESSASDASGSGSGSGGGAGSGSGGDRTPIPEPNPNILGLDVAVTGGVYFGAIFASVIMSVLFKSFWCVVFASAKMMEPFYQLAKEGTGVTAEASVLRPYLQGGIDWPDLNPANKYWVMFLTTVISVFLSVQASLASEAMTVQAGATCNVDGSTKLCDPVWVMNSAVIRGLQATLVLVALMIAVLVWLNWNRLSAVTSYPCSIASMASLLSNSDNDLIEDLRRIDPDAKDHEVTEALKDKLFSFKKSETESGLDIIGISVRSGEADSNADTIVPGAGTMCAAGVGPDDLATAVRPPSSWLSRIPWTKIYIFTITILHLALFGVILSFVLAGNDIYQVNLIGADGAEHLTAVKWKFLDGTKFGPRFFMTLLTSLLFIPFWEMVELEVRIMVPYRALQSQKHKYSTESRYLFTMYLHGVPFTSFFKAVWHRNWYHAFIAFTTVLAYVLLVLIAGVPYNYGQIKNVTFYSSVVSATILFIMIVAMVSLVFWHATNPKMPRKPDTLVNTWLMMCASRFVADFRDRPSAEVVAEVHDGREGYWFGKDAGVDGTERWMIEAHAMPASKVSLHVQETSQGSFF